MLHVVPTQPVRAACAAMSRGPAVLLSLLVAVVALPGCGAENKLGRLPISGTVTLDGQPLEQGSIAFIPQGGGQNATRSGKTISNGQFSIPAQDGLPPGEYLVRIHSAGDAPAENSQPKAPGALPPPAKELIPPKWNTQSQETVTVKEGDDNHFEFSITTGG